MNNAHKPPTIIQRPVKQDALVLDDPVFQRTSMPHTNSAAVGISAVVTKQPLLRGVTIRPMYAKMNVTQPNTNASMAYRSTKEL